MFIAIFIIWCYYVYKEANQENEKSWDKYDESLRKWHDELAKEMLERGYNHKSDYILPDLSYLPDSERYAKADINYNFKDLMNRCTECRERIINEQS